MGGILSAEDAVGKIEVGADVVQIYTGFIYQGPGLVQETGETIKRKLQINNSAP
ncbi:hypothetical protein ACQV5M_20400 [Leptospira sp. SA-E8]|uniref:hypothetical protein n=1 Tax=Leptospira sp. SA-E8 TaxID=3422259 RepID=UPI003EBDFEEB